MCKAIPTRDSQPSAPCWRGRGEERDVSKEQPDGRKPFCAQVSQERGDSGIGTAPPVHLWFLLEYTKSWGENVTMHNSFPAPIHEWIIRIHQMYPDARVQLIKQQQKAPKMITLFIGVSQEERQVLYQFQVESYEDLLNLNIQAIVAGHPAYAKWVYQDSLFLVCTHGKHDRCCAKFGLPVYTELAKRVGKRAWQCSHLGGDEFAANLLWLPSGIYYGRVTPADIDALITASSHQQIFIAKYRGRTCYPAEVQAADYFLHARFAQQSTHVSHIPQSDTFDAHRLNAFRLLSVHNDVREGWNICFEELHNHTIHQICMQVEQMEVTSYSVCRGIQIRSSRSFHLKKHALLEPITERG